MAVQKAVTPAGGRGRPIARNNPVPGYGPGMWAWILQRVTGLLMVALVFAHFWSKVLFPARGPVPMAVDLTLILLVCYHAFNGIRIALIDLGVGIRAQRAIFWGAVALALVTAAFGLKAYLSWYM